jgi:hypothetical protein
LFPWRFSHLAALLPLAGVLGIAAQGAVASWGIVPSLVGPLTLPLFLVVVGAMLVSLWDGEARFGFAGLYVSALAGFLLGYGELHREERWLALPAFAGFITLMSLCRRAGPLAEDLMSGLRIPARERGWPAAWFVPVQTLLALGVVVASVVRCLGAPLLSDRMAGPLGVALLLPAVALQVRSPHSMKRSLAQTATLALVALALLEAAWAGVERTGPIGWLERTTLVLTVCSILAPIYGLLLPLWLLEESGWPKQGWRASLGLGALALLLLGATLAQEVWLTEPGLRMLLPAPIVLAGAAGVVLLILVCLSLAVVPDLDPLSLSERGRMGYVYAGELLLVALFAHLRLAAPAWFTGRLGEYWTFAVLGLAFVGAGLGEIFGRMKLRVLAEPLRYTGLFLPAIPVLIFWSRPEGEHAPLWFLIGLFYGTFSVVWWSLAFAALGALAVHVGLWLVLHQQGKAFLEHPQLWLVPFASTLLLGAHLNRDRLTRQQLFALRWAALTVLYLASASEMFLAGLGPDQPMWRPLVLLGLSLVGVFAGMLLRVRAFLFLGTAFVALGVFALIWHAATTKSWVWQVAGIVLGLLIIVLFAIFEKRRNDVLHLLEKLREWE